MGKDRNRPWNSRGEKRNPRRQFYLCLVAAMALLAIGSGIDESGLPLERETAPELLGTVPAPAAVQPMTPSWPLVGRAPAPVPTPDVSVVLRELVLRDERSVADLATLLDSASVSSVRGRAAQLLAEIGTPSAVAALLHAIARAPSGEPPDELLAAFDSLANPEVAPALSAFLLETREPEVVTRVRDTLARLADAPGVLEIVTALHEGSPERWQQANLEGALLSVRSPAAVPVLREVLLRDSNPTLRAQAALVLGYIGGSESAEALATALSSSHSSAFTAAITESLALLRGRAGRNSSQEPDPP